MTSNNNLMTSNNTLSTLNDTLIIKELIMNNQMLYTGMRMASIASRVITRKIKELEQWLIFPLTITNGVLPITNSGYKPINSIPQNYSEFILAITGNATIIAQWKNAFKLEQVFKGTAANQFKDANQYYKKIINPKNYDTERGDMYEAFLETATSGTTISSEGTPNNIFKGISTKRQYTLLCLSKQFTQNDGYNLYIVLNKNNQNIGGETINTYEYNQSIQLLFLSDIENKYDPFDNKKLLYQRLTFSSINDLLDSSGMAIWQKVQFAAIGEGYFLPRIIDGVVDYDPVLAIDTGVTDIDLKIRGITALSSFSIVGRPIRTGVYNEIVYPPRDLLFSASASSLPDTLLVNSNPSNVLYNLQDLQPANETTYGEWLNRFDIAADKLKKKNAEGVIQTNLVKTQASNPDKIPFWDSGISFKPTGLYNTKQNLKIVYQDPLYNDPVIGDTVVDYSKILEPNFHNILNMNRYTHSTISLLPYKVNEYTKFSINKLPIIGKIANFFVAGLPIKLMTQKDTRLIPKITQVNAFMDQLVYDVIQASLWTGASAGKGLIPLDLYRNETEDQVGALLGSNSLTFGCLLKLTDKVNVYAWGKLRDDPSNIVKMGKRTYTTLDLGQDRAPIWLDDDFDRRTFLSEVPLVNEEMLAMDKDEELTKADSNLEFNPDINGQYESYVIDLVSLQTIGKCNWKLTTYSANPFTIDDNITAFQNFQGEWETSAHFIDNIQAWMTVVKTSSLDYDLLEDTKFFYPRDILPPDPFRYKPVTYTIMEAKELKITTYRHPALKLTNMCKSKQQSAGLMPADEQIKILVPIEFVIDLKTKLDPSIKNISQFKRNYSTIKLSNEALRVNQLGLLPSMVDTFSGFDVNTYASTKIGVAKQCNTGMRNLNNVMSISLGNNVSSTLSLNNTTRNIPIASLSAQPFSNSFFSSKSNQSRTIMYYQPITFFEQPRVELYATFNETFGNKLTFTLSNDLILRIKIEKEELVWMEMFREKWNPQYVNFSVALNGSSGEFTNTIFLENNSSVTPWTFTIIPIA